MTKKLAGTRREQEKRGWQSMFHRAEGVRNGEEKKGEKKTFNGKRRGGVHESGRRDTKAPKRGGGKTEWKSFFRGEDFVGVVNGGKGGGRERTASGKKFCEGWVLAWGT